MRQLLHYALMGNTLKQWLSLAKGDLQLALARNHPSTMLYKGASHPRTFLLLPLTVRPWDASRRLLEGA